jgi:hypothetical protein
MIIDNINEQKSNPITTYSQEIVNVSTVALPN